MSNIEIVRLKACFLQDFEVKWVKNDKCTIKDKRKPNVYVYEAYFVSKGDFFQKYILFRTGNFFFLKNTEFFKKEGILCEKT